MAPTLIPRAKLFGNPSRFGARLSPDGQWLSWLAPRDGVLNIWLAPADNLGAAAPLTKVTGRPIASHDWTYDGRNILYPLDENGDENWNIFAIDRASGETRNLTPLPGIAAQQLMRSPDRPGTVLLGINDRDKRWHDVWSVDLGTGERNLVLENTGGFYGFEFDWQLRPRIARQPDEAKGGSILCRLVDGRFERFVEIPQEDELATQFLLFNRAGSAFSMLSSVGRDTSALVRIDASSGAETVLAQGQRADIDLTIANPETFEVDAVGINHVRREWTAVNPAIARDMAFLQERLKGFEFQVESQTTDNSRWVLLAYDAGHPATYFLYDRPRGGLTELFSARPELKDYPLRPMQGHVVKSRDGLDLVTYLTLPDREEQPTEPLPTVLVVHGGPWWRDSFGYRGDHQWLANRGYAVLSVNYRASTGFGKAFLNAGDKEHAGRMHDDLLDAVDWAVREGVTRRDKVAIMGASYGGYATLVGLTFTPETFCCGVSIVGISNLITLLTNIPPYWAAFNDQILRRYGDPRTEEGRALLRERSPLFKADRITRPLLIAHGQNDVRCNVEESDQIVAAMRERGLPVTYVVYPDEGHGFARPENRLSFFAVAESFLAEHLGGRAEPVGDDFAGSSLDVRQGAEHVAGLDTALAAKAAADAQP